MTAQKDIVDLSLDLIRLDSTDDNVPMQHQCLDLISNRFGNIFNIQTYNIKGHPAIVMTSNGEKYSDVTVSGHIDVVAGEAENFKPAIKNGKLYGRGAYDMKAGLVAYIFAAADYIKMGGKKSIAVMITSDEETGGLGTRYLLGKEGYKSQFAIIADGGTDTQIVLKQKGVLHVKISIDGTAAHGAYPWLGENAIVKAHNLYQILIDKHPQPHHAEQWRTSILLSRIESSNSINQVPGTANLYLDIRYIDKESYKDIIDTIVKYTGNEKSITILAEHSLFYSDTNNPNVKLLAKSINNITNKKVSYEFENGASDAVFFTEYGIPAALFRPIGGNLHHADEWVDTKSLYDTYKIVLNYLNSL